MRPMTADEELDFCIACDQWLHEHYDPNNPCYIRDENGRFVVVDPNIPEEIKEYLQMLNDGNEYFMQVMQIHNQMNK